MRSPASSDFLFFIARGSGPPLLLVHGLGMSGGMFELIVEPLAKRHRLIIPDLRGCGRSSNMRPPYSVKQQAADLASLLDHLGIASTDALGYSQGGPVVQELALDYPAKVRRLVLSNTYAYNMVTMKEKMEGHIVPLLIHLLGVRLFVKLMISQGLKQIPKERAPWVANLIAGTWGKADPKSIELAWKEAMAFDSRGRLHEINCPTLVIAGSDDKAVPMHHAKMLHDGIAGSRLVVISGADHALMWARPDEWLAKVSEFLDLPRPKIELRPSPTGLEPP
jgi:pimeloyl-ACP methyl ester carboxylesterase